MSRCGHCKFHEHDGTKHDLKMLEFGYIPCTFRKELGAYYHHSFASCESFVKKVEKKDKVPDFDLF